ncbi:MAG: hypothetical protein KDD73_08650 [Anaerolineales bacterium]|nr:hypothetical protein [Anaerolineales bacterium]MCB9126790.1 hypothetical protein [Ardenticatenales bacterium]MCB9172649.1 hypothetical protein [Ardenticatenales bacterium]
MNQSTNPSATLLDQIGNAAQAALQNRDIPTLYANGFISGVGAGGDLYLILQTNGQSSAVVNLSWVTLKTAVQNLTQILEEVESRLEQEIPTIPQLQSRLTKQRAKTA